jgi:hypothetical protein
VSTWRLRTIGVLLMIALAGGPVADVVCDAQCSPASTPASGGEGDEGPAPAIAEHGHHHPAAASASAPAATARLNGSDGPEACRVPAQTPVSLTAARADRSLVSVQQPAGLLPIEAAGDVSPCVAWPTRGGPPGATSSPGVSGVLRI